MRLANVFAALMALVWAYLLYAGVDGVRGIAAQHVTGYPNESQILFYIAAPAAAVICLLALVGFFNFKKRSASTLGLAGVVALILLLPFLFLYGGGV